MKGAHRGSGPEVAAGVTWGAFLLLLVVSLFLFGCHQDGSTTPMEAAVGSQAASSGTNGTQRTSITTIPVDSLDALYSQLANRVNERVNEGGTPSSDFLVTPFPFGEWALGTVLQQNRSVPVTYNACRPAPNDPEVMSQDVPTLFSAYSMNRDISVEAGLDDAVFQGLLSANGGANLGESVNFEISNTSTQLWSDVGLAQMLATVTCRSALQAGSTYRLVRGLVSGKRQFAFGIKMTVSGSVKVPAVAHLTLSVAPNDSMVTVSDDHTAGFLAILSEFTVPSAPSKLDSIALGVVVSKPIAVKAAGNTGKIYIQRDSSDSVANANAVVAKLTAAHFDLANVIETVPSDRMPSTPQVRYFRPEDLNKAQQALSVLQQIYANAKLVTLRIPSPPGQLEVWLQKVGPVGK